MEFFMNFLNIEKLKMYYFQYFMFASRFHAISNIKKKIGVKINNSGGHCNISRPRVYGAGREIMTWAPVITHLIDF